MTTSSAPPDLKADSLERLVPDRLASGDATGDETLRLHLQRYEFAAVNLHGTRVLDLACGVGYGTRLLSDRCPAAVVLGVDLSPAAVEYAQGRYGNERTRYAAADAYRFDDPTGFDTIVSLETIEHLPDPRRFVERLTKLLRPGGIAIASVPTTPSVDANPHHRSDFTEDSFRELFRSQGFSEVDFLRQVQPFSLLAMLTRRETRAAEVRPGLLRYYVAHPDAFLRRIAATLRYGFTNRYVTVVWRRG